MSEKLKSFKLLNVWNQFSFKGNDFNWKKWRR